MHSRCLLLALLVWAPLALATGGDPAHQEDHPVRAFEGDSLYKLLAAEVAGFRGDFDFALAQYSEAARETRDPNVAARASRLALYMKRPELALELLDIWLAAEPSSAEAQRQALNLLARSNRPAGALRYAALSALLDSQLEDPQLAFVQATILERVGKPEAALAIIDRLLADEADTGAMLVKAGLLASLSRQAESLAFVRARLAERPQHRGLRLMLARLLFDQGDLAGARKEYELALRKQPQDGEALFALALIALEAGDDQAAQGYLRRMVRWNQRRFEAHYHLGGIAERQGDRAQALKEYALVEDGYRYVPAQARVAALLADDGRLPEARQRLQAARQARPAHEWQLLLVEGQLLTERGMKEAVFALLDQRLAEEPQNVDLLYYRAMTGQKFDRLDILEADLRTIIALEPDHADALNALGYTLTDQTDRHEEALALIEKALALRPDEPAFIDSMGWVQYRLKNYEEALRHLRRALALYPNDEIAAHLGEVLWVTGRHKEAEAVWEEALELTPDSEILKETIARLQEAG